MYGVDSVPCLADSYLVPDRTPPNPSNGGAFRLIVDCEEMRVPCISSRFLSAPKGKASAFSQIFVALSRPFRPQKIVAKPTKKAERFHSRAH